MKRVISAILTAFIIISFLPSVFAADGDWKPEAHIGNAIPKGKNVVARLAIGSDVHIGVNYASAKLENAYDALGRLGGVDALILAGDLTQDGKPEQYTELMRIVQKYSKTLPAEVDGTSVKGAGNSAPVGTTILEMGNHDFNSLHTKAEAKFMETTGQTTDKLYWVNEQVPVIKVSMTDHDFTYDDTYISKHDFIKASLDAIDAKGYKGHIFLVTHIAVSGTVIGAPSADEEAFDPKTIKLLESYPNLVHVSGHSHQIINNPTFIDQTRGFTSVTDGVMGEDYNNDKENHGSSVVIFDVMSDGTTEIHRVDLQNGRLIYGNEDWVLDSSDKPEDFKYFSAKTGPDGQASYGANAGKPSFGEGATVTFEYNDDHDSINVTFTSNAIPASDKNYDYVRRYRVRATPVNGEGATVTVNVVNDSYRPDNRLQKTRTATLTGLDWNTDYKITVYPQNAYGDNGKSIVAAEYANVGIPEFDDAVLLYDVDYSYGGVKDALGHKETLSAIYKSVFVDDIGQYAVEFQEFQTHRYDFGPDDLETLRNGFTAECYFKAVDTDPKQVILGAYASFGFDYIIEEGELKVLCVAKNESENTPLSVPINKGEWVHAVTVYNGKELTLYVNGELAASIRHTGGLEAEFTEDSEDNAYLINVGGRAPSGGDGYRVKKGTMVNSFRVFSGIVSADDVKTLYTKVQKPNVQVSFDDVDEGSWYEASVIYAYEEGLMSGTSSSAFSPSVKTTRAMLVRMLYNMEGSPEVDKSSNPFTDVANDAWYTDAVLWAYQNGVTTGTSATTFSPDALVTREQVAVFLYRFVKDYKNITVADGADLSVYPDVDSISPYAGFKEAVAWANKMSILSGKKSGDVVNLAPQDTAMRSETATMFARFHRVFFTLK